MRYISNEDIKAIQSHLKKPFSGFLNISKGFCYCFGEDDEKEVFNQLEMIDLLDQIAIYHQRPKS